MSSSAKGTPVPIPASDRSAWRDTYIYASNDRDKVLGGLYVTYDMTNKNLYAMVEIICVLTDTFYLEDDSEQVVDSDDYDINPGNYYIVTNGSVKLIKEAPIFRSRSKKTGTRCAAFCNAVRLRDRRCIITGRPAVVRGVAFWAGFDAAHIFPLKYYELWNKDNFGQWITVPPASESHGTINSVQNGIFLSREIHSLFDDYQISINPDDDYKIVSFTPQAETLPISGRCLDDDFLSDPQRPPDQLLRWHFRQAVLANVAGA